MTLFYPQTEQALMQKANSMQGKTLLELATELQCQLPDNLKRHKGWIGQLIEAYLGAQAGNLALPDFIHLGIELKTIPVNAQGLPLETTFISVAPLLPQPNLTWEQSAVYQKLKKTLWIPIQGDKNTLLAEKTIGKPCLHDLTEIENQQLKTDWLELTEMIVLGQVEQIKAHFGEYLQLRPKAANGKALTQSINEDGDLIYTRPRGFYVRKNFTFQLLCSHVL